MRNRKKKKAEKNVLFNRDGEPIQEGQFYASQGPEIYFTKQTSFGLITENSGEGDFLYMKKELLSQKKKKIGLVGILNLFYFISLSVKDIKRTKTAAQQRITFFRKYAQS